jgi:integrase/recombinase XerD
MSDPSHVRVRGPLEPYAHGFGAQLFQLGYTRISAAFQLQLMAHLSRWLGCEGLDASGLTLATVEAFLTARRNAGYTNYRSVKALVPLLDYLRGLGAAPPTQPVVPTPAEALLERYRAYLIRERGVTGPTARGYADMVRPFLAGHATPDGELDLQELAPGHVTSFVLAQSPLRSRGSAKLLVTALRSFLLFLHVDGVLTRPLADAVPSVAGWRLAGLPRVLDADQVRRLLASCNHRGAISSRDLAVLTMLVRLGLRAGEAAGLRLDDIEWRRGEITVRGKGARREQVPLPVDVGQALVAYLRHYRPVPVDGCRRLFLRTRAPHRGLTPGGVTQIVARGASRAGLPLITAHRLRHTAATRLLEAGAPLSEVGQLLRHRRQLTTAIYTKVNRDALRTVAHPWPGGAA